jgi:hypothetical protein
VIALPFTGQTR